MRVHSRLIGLAAVATAALLAAGCAGGSAGTEPAKKGGGTVTVRSCTPEHELIGSNTTEVCGGNIVDAFTAKLIRYNPDTAKPEMDIAESIESSDNVTFTVKLKKGYKFHDGTEVKAKNFVDAWNFAAYGPSGQSNSYFFEPIAGYADLQCSDAECSQKPAADKMSGLSVVDDHTFTIKMVEPVSNLPIRLGYSAFVPQPDAFFAAEDKKKWAKSPIGAGPFKVTSVSDTGTELEKFADYSGTNKPSIDKVVFKVYNDGNTAYTDVVANNLDLTDLIPADQLVGDAYKAQLPDRHGVRDTGIIHVNTFSPKDEQLKDVRMRQAISMAVDKALITKQVYNDTRAPATGWVSPVADGYKEGACGDNCSFNPAKAKELYDAAGGYQGTFQLSVNGDGGHKLWADAFCSQLKNNLNMDCQVNVTPDFKTLRTQIKARELKGMYRGGWQMDYPNIENFLTPIYSKGGSSNDSDYDNPAFDAKLVEAAKATDAAQANAFYQEAEAMLAKDMPTMPLWTAKTPFGYSDKVTNVKMTPFSTFDLVSISVK